MTHTISIPFRHALLFVLCCIPLCALADGSSLNSKTLSDAWSGKADAQYELGLDHESSDESDYDKAFEWYSKAAQQNHAQAQCALGYCYMFARGCDYRPDKAAEWCGAFAFCLMSSVNFCLSAASLSAIAMCYAGLLLGDTLRFSGQSAGFGRHTLRILLALMLLGGLFLQLRFAVAHVVLRNAAGTSGSSCNPEQLAKMVSLEKRLRHSDAYWCTRAEKTAACGDYAAATDCLREALKYTNFAQVHHQMYLYCRKSGDTAGAVQALRQETGVTPGRLAPRYMLWQYYVSLQDTVHARETASDLIQATRFSDESIAPRYRQIMQEYLDNSGSESVPGQTGRPVSD